VTRAARRARLPPIACKLVLALALAGCELGPFGGTALRGERVAEPVRDWSFAEPRYFVEIQTHAGSLLPSARTWFVVHEGTLWLYTMSTGGLEPPWLGRLRDEDPGVTIGVDGRLHEGVARLVTEPAELEPLLPRVLAKYHMVEVDGARFARSERFPGTQIRHWFFRVEPPPR
jgi:hypothetical protein